MAKIKMRCGRCSKKFTASNAKQMFCPECEAQLRAQRAAAKTAGAKQAAGATAAHAPKIVGPGASILVPGLAPTRSDVPPEVGSLGLGPRTDHGRDGQKRTPHAHDTQGGSGTAHQPHHSAPAPARTDGRVAPESPAAQAQKGQDKEQHKGQEKGQHSERTQPQKVVRQQREPKAPRPAVPAIELTDELREKIEQRYLELAHPVEFDGIRTQIAGELSVPKALVKRAVIDLRTRMQMPSWWELQTYTGGNTELDRIRRAYMPLLPVPPIGVHKTIAQELGLDAATVYQGIKRIRAEMRWPRFNAPALHDGEAGARPATGTEAKTAPGPVTASAELANATEAR